MSTAPELHVGDIGTVITVTVNEGGSAADISTFTATKDFIIRKPDGSVVTWSASFMTDGTDGKVQYSIVNGDLDQEGWYQIEVALVDDSGNTFRSSRERMFVHGVIA